MLNDIINLTITATLTDNDIMWTKPINSNTCYRKNEN